MAVNCSVSRTANFRHCWGLDRTRGSHTALVTEVHLGTLRGELAVPQKMTERGLAACGASWFDVELGRIDELTTMSLPQVTPAGEGGGCISERNKEIPPTSGV